MICCTKLVVRDCPKCDIGDITNRDNPASSSTNTTKPTTTANKTTTAASTSTSNVTEVTNKSYPEGLFTGFIKGSQRYKGTLVYHANDASKRKEYQGDFVNGNL